MQRTIIFVAGIHGVGKTFFCQQAANKLDLEHVSASTLIKQAKQRSSEQQKAVANVSQNQDALIAELQKHQWHSRVLLLDGHFCLLTTTGTMQPVPIETFQKMNPASVILLTAPVTVIQARLQSRDSQSYSIDLLEALQTAEIHQAHGVCAELNIPLLTIMSDDLTEALDFIRRTTTLQKD